MLLKKILILFILLIFPFNAYAIEEVKLEKESLNLDYFSNVYYGKVEETEKVSPILKLFSQNGLEFNKSKCGHILKCFYILNTLLTIK